LSEILIMILILYLKYHGVSSDFGPQVEYLKQLLTDYDKNFWADSHWDKEFTSNIWEQSNG